MSLSDCPNCWDTPCTCGYEYERYPEEKLRKIATAVSEAMIRRNTFLRPNPLPDSKAISEWVGNNCADSFINEYKAIIHCISSDGTGKINSVGMDPSALRFLISVAMSRFFKTPS